MENRSFGPRAARRLGDFWERTSNYVRQVAKESLDDSGGRRATDDDVGESYHLEVVLSASQAGWEEGGSSRTAKGSLCHLAVKRPVTFVQLLRSKVLTAPGHNDAESWYCRLQLYDKKHAVHVAGSDARFSLALADNSS